jgi:hypothetical protein
MTFRMLTLVVIIASLSRAQTTGTPILTTPITVGTTPPPTGQRYLQLGGLQNEDAAKARAAGTRFTVPGNERQVLTGSLTASSAGTPAVPVGVTVTTQTSGQVRIDYASGLGSVVFTGTAITATSAAIGTADSSIMESFTQDSSDYFLFSRAAGLPVRRIGVFASLPDPVSSNPPSTCELVQMWIPASSTSNTLNRMKKYCFDATSHLLTAVLYVESSGTRVETRYTGWTTVNGQAVPGNITRRENGVVVFSLQVQSVTFVPFAADSTFSALTSVIQQGFPN